MTGDQIYWNFQNGRGPGGLAEAVGIMKPMVEKYNEIAGRIKQVAARLETHWEGEAGNAASRGAGPLAVEFEMAAPHIHRAQDLSEKQTELFSITKNTVVKVPPKPDKPDPIAVLLDPTGTVGDYDSALRAHHDAASLNVDQMNKYTDYSRYNGQNQPSTYGKILTDESSISVDNGDTNGNTVSGRQNTGWNQPPQPGHGVSPSHNSGYQYQPDDSTTGRNVTALPDTSGNPTTQQPGGPVTTGTSAASVAPSPDVPGAQLGYGAPAAPGTGGSPSGGHAPSGYGTLPGGPSGQQGVDNHGRPLPGGTTQGGSGTAPKEPTSRQPGSSAGIGERAGSGRPTSGGTASKSTAPNERSGMRPATGARGGGGNDDDYEHERPDFLVMADPDDFWFGGLPPVAPPTIE